MSEKVPMHWSKGETTCFVHYLQDLLACFRYFMKVKSMPLFAGLFNIQVKIVQELWQRLCEVSAGSQKQKPKP